MMCVICVMRVICVTCVICVIQLIFCSICKAKRKTLLLSGSSWLGSHTQSSRPQLVCVIVLIVCMDKSKMAAAGLIIKGAALLSQHCTHALLARIAYFTFASHTAQSLLHSAHQSLVWMTTCPHKAPAVDIHPYLVVLFVPHEKWSAAPLQQWQRVAAEC